MVFSLFTKYQIFLLLHHYFTYHSVCPKYFAGDFNIFVWSECKSFMVFRIPDIQKLNCWMSHMIIPILAGSLLPLNPSPSTDPLSASPFPSKYTWPAASFPHHPISLSNCTPSIHSHPTETWIHKQLTMIFLTLTPISWIRKLPKGLRVYPTTQKS